MSNHSSDLREHDHDTRKENRRLRRGGGVCAAQLSRYYDTHQLQKESKRRRSERERERGRGEERRAAVGSLAILQ